MAAADAAQDIASGAMADPMERSFFRSAASAADRETTRGLSGTARRR